MNEYLQTQPDQAELAPAGSNPPGDATASSSQPSACTGRAWHFRRPGPLVTIVLVGALLRILLWFWFDGQTIHIWDEHDYNRLATNLLEHGEFAFAPGKLTSLRPPLYPAFVAVVYRLFGLDNFQAVRLLQAGLSLATLLLLYRLGTILACRQTGLWLAGLYGFYPSLLVYNNLLLTEVLFTFLLCAACYLMVAALRRKSAWLLASAGALFGLAALTRSVVWLLPPLLALFLVLCWPGSLRRRLLAAFVLVAACVATITPWALRNSRLERTFVAIDTMGGRNFMMGNYEFTPLYRSWAADDLMIGEKSWFAILSSTYPQPLWETQGQRDKLALRYGLKYIAANPGLTVARDLVKFLDFWGLERELIGGAQRGYFGAMPTFVVLFLAVLICASYAVVLLLGIFGAILTPPPEGRYHIFLLLIIGYLCGMHTLVFGHSRYHLPIIPLVMVYTASAVVNRRKISSQRYTRSYWLASSVCGLFFLGWLWRMAVDLQLSLELVRGSR